MMCPRIWVGLVSLVPLFGCSGQQPPLTELRVDAIQDEELAELAPLAQISDGGAEGITNKQWERLKQSNLDAPPNVWRTTATDHSAQQDEFHRWREATPFVSQDVNAVILKWLDSGDLHFNEVITNKPTGAQYRVRCDRSENGAECSIKFVGNINWD